jgi:hypothetical protein
MASWYITSRDNSLRRFGPVSASAAASTRTSLTSFGRSVNTVTALSITLAKDRFSRCAIISTRIPTSVVREVEKAFSRIWAMTFPFHLFHLIYMIPHISKSCQPYGQEAIARLA